MTGGFAQNVHGTALCLALVPDQAPVGIMLLGPPGIGKTTLALGLIESCPDGRSALVADDSVMLTAREGRLAAAAPPGFSGLVEITGTGLARLPAAEGPVPLFCAFVLTGEEGPRLPEERTYAPLGADGPYCPLYVWRRARGIAGFRTFMRSVLAGHGVLCGHDRIGSSGSGS
jgi:hypothetical protein